MGCGLYEGVPLTISGRSVIQGLGVVYDHGGYF